MNSRKELEAAVWAATYAAAFVADTNLSDADLTEQGLKNIAGRSARIASTAMKYLPRKASEEQPTATGLCSKHQYPNGPDRDLACTICFPTEK